MKDLTFKEYPFSWSIQDSIKARVNWESEQLIKEPIRELRPDTSKHPMQFSETFKRTFSADIKSYLP